jgi:hypothetical protein
MASVGASSSHDKSTTVYSAESNHPAKYAHISRAEAPESTRWAMQCELPPHNILKFASYEAYEIHYQQCHINCCSECEKNFPSDHYLNLHISENHDPITAIKRERGERTVYFSNSNCSDSIVDHD